MLGGIGMMFMGKEVEDLVVTLPLVDGTEVECGVYKSFEVNGKTYFALLPLIDGKSLDFSHNYMLYRVEMDQDQNPVVMYIENDIEYEIAAHYFLKNILNH